MVPVRQAAWSAARMTLDVVMVTAVLLFAFLAVGPRLLPYRTVTMLTGSMAPRIPVGSVAVDVAEPVSALRPGEVVTFHAPTPGHPVVTHRVMSVEHRDGRVLVRTRGDANSADDPWLAVVHGDTVWRVRAVVPWLGSAIRLLRAPSVHLAVAWAVPGALLAWFLAGVWRRPSSTGRRRAVAMPAQRDVVGVGGGEPGWSAAPSSSASAPSSSLPV